MERLLARQDRRAWPVEPLEVARLIETHCAGQANHAHVLFSLMVFERWAEQYAI
jgi:hypothetical protein